MVDQNTLRAHEVNYRDFNISKAFDNNIYKFLFIKYPLSHVGSDFDQPYDKKIMF